VPAHAEPFHTDSLENAQLGPSEPRLVANGLLLGAARAGYLQSVRRVTLTGSEPPRFTGL
jgi:hypothetical protein